MILSYEKGFNNYVKVDEALCNSAIKWWDENKNKWELVRDKWSEVYSRNKNLKLKKSVKNNPLYMVLFSTEINQVDEINSVIESYIN